MEDAVYAEAEQRQTSPATVMRDAICQRFGLPVLPEYPTPEQKSRGGYWSEPWKRRARGAS